MTYDFDIDLSKAAAVAPLATISATRATLERFGLYTKHCYGQNFLINAQVIARILNLAELDSGSVVLEIGPGIGTLTQGLLKYAGAVVAVEFDHRLKDVLASTCAGYTDKFALIIADAVRLSPQRIGEALAALSSERSDSMPTHVVANLPYQVAATLILRYLQEMSSVMRMVVMVQAEVADRIMAQPGTKAYGAYTAKLALYAKVTGRFDVAAGNFFPRPRVQSAVVRIDRRESVAAGARDMAAGARDMAGGARDMADGARDMTDGACDMLERQRVCAIIDASFAHRRKTLRNALGAFGYSRSVIEHACAMSDIDPARRAETLSPHAFVTLTRNLSYCQTAYEKGR